MCIRDRVETGHFASLWNKMALKLGIKTEFLETDWRRGVEPEKLFDRLKKDTEKKEKVEKSKTIAETDREKLEKKFSKKKPEKLN